MRINGNPYDQPRPVGPAAGASARPESQPEPTASAPAARPARSDSVEISALGRALAGGEPETLSPERLAELRQRVLEGAYNSVEIADLVARRILDGDDL